jgi:hypothetical protein
MKNPHKSFQQSTLNSNENIDSFWQHFQKEYPVKYRIHSESQFLWSHENQACDSETAFDFMEIWMRIEESIMDFDLREASQKIQLNPD